MLFLSLSVACRAVLVRGEMSWSVCEVVGPAEGGIDWSCHRGFVREKVFLVAVRSLVPWSMGGLKLGVFLGLHIYESVSSSGTLHRFTECDDNPAGNRIVEPKYWMLSALTRLQVCCHVSRWIAFLNHKQIESLIMIGSDSMLISKVSIK